MVFALDVFHSGSIDSEDRHPSTVRPAHLDAQKLSASDETQGSEEEVIGLNHGFTSFLSNAGVGCVGPAPPSDAGSGLRPRWTKSVMLWNEEERLF